jgi:hypothetical protein
MMQLDEEYQESIKPFSSSSVPPDLLLMGQPPLNERQHWQNMTHHQ